MLAKCFLHIGTALTACFNWLGQLFTRAEAWPVYAAAFGLLTLSAMLLVPLRGGSVMSGSSDYVGVFDSGKKSDYAQSEAYAKSGGGAFQKGSARYNKRHREHVHKSTQR